MWSTIHHSQQQLVQSMLQHFRHSSITSRMHCYTWHWTHYGGKWSTNDCIAHSMHQSSCYWRLYPCLFALGSRSCRTAGLWRNDSFSASVQKWYYFLRGQEHFFCDDILVWRHASSSSDWNGQEAKAGMNHGWRDGIYLKLFVHVKVDVRHCTQVIIVHRVNDILH